MPKIKNIIKNYREKSLPEFLRYILFRSHVLLEKYRRQFLEGYNKQLFLSQVTKVGENLYIGPYPHRVIKSESAEIIIGDNVTFWSPIELVSIDYTPDTKIIIGDNVNIGNYCSIRAYKHVEIGSNCLLAPYVRVIDQNAHPLNPELRKQRKPLPEREVRPVIIEDNVWIGEMAIILPGVRIGEGSVIGANSVVTKDVPPRKIVIGNPARVVGWI